MTENVEKTRLIYAAINAGDLEAVFSHFHDDVTIHEPPGLSYGGCRLRATRVAPGRWFGSGYFLDSECIM
jgi:ketosteroid isomerase-like protein